MQIDRRAFLKLSGGVSGAALVPASAFGGQAATGSTGVPGSMTDDIVPISLDERRARIEQARQLMIEEGIEAIYLDSGSNLFYFTGVRWGSSERMFAAVLPARGEIAYVCPKFEEDRAHELIRLGTDVRTWEEDESPYERVAEILVDRGVTSGRVGMEERVRFFLFDGVRKAAPALDYVSADPVTAGCRMFKSAAELALMQRAMDITIEAYRAVIPKLEKGMTKGEFRTLTVAAHAALGAQGSIGVNFGESSALPHGSILPRDLREGDVVLMDGGCSVDGYRSDISRTVVFGTPTRRQKDTFDLMKRAQTAAFEAATLGTPCGDVDAAARQLIVDHGFGPDYQVPGCPHRTGHGIGLDGHEWTNLVRGNTTPLSPGMCFSNEPTIVLPGEFGIRIEDCFFMTDEGPTYFTLPSPSLEQPNA